jgi:putative oxidoreductase
MDAALLIVRLVFGLLMTVHGSQKLFGWFGGPGLGGTASFIESVGFRPARPFALANALAEFCGGVLLALGLFVPLAAAAIISVMIVAIVTVHWSNGLLTIDNGIELPMLYLTTSLALAIIGPGTYSFDAALELSRWWTPQLTGIVLAGGALGALLSLKLRRSAPTVSHA